MSEQRFAGRVAVVTGGGGGIGAAVARAFGAAGATVCVLDRDAAAAETVGAAIEAGGGRAHAFTVNVARGDEVRECLATCVDRCEGLDVVVNNAAVVRYADVTRLSEADWDLQIDTNVKGVYNVCHHAIPLLRARGGGAVVNLSSVQALASQALVVAYAASKAAVLSMTKTMAVDHAGDGIRVNCVLPGSVRTGMLQYAAEVFGEDDPAAAIESWGRAHPLGRVIEPDEVARVVLFLASDEAAAVTGAAWTVDGGLSARLAV